jgi:hypothetical protein
LDAEEYGAQKRLTQTCKITFPECKPFFLFIESISGYNGLTMRVWFLHKDTETDQRKWIPFSNPTGADESEKPKSQRGRGKKTASPASTPRAIAAAVAQEFKKNIPNITNLRDVFHILLGAAKI